jgi:hypothetical protein
MRGGSFRSRRAVGTWLLIVVLLAPGAFASNTTVEPGLWAEFVGWLAGQCSLPGGITEAGEDAFTAWLMVRHTIPGG